MPLTDHGKKFETRARLSPRLLAVAAQVPPCGRVIDIGTDHAWLPIWLVQNGRCRSAVAIDNKEGPLRTARSHVRAAGLADRIQVLQSDGLMNMQVNQDDALVLSGLGGYEIMDILGESMPACRAIIIQAQKTLPELRAWLGGHGCEIFAEKLVKEDGRFYIIMTCRPDGAVQPLTALESWAGPVLIKENPPDYRQYLANLHAHLQKKCRGAPELQPIVCQLEALLARYGQDGPQMGKEEFQHE